MNSEGRKRGTSDLESVASATPAKRRKYTANIAPFRPPHFSASTFDPESMESVRPTSKLDILRVFDSVSDSALEVQIDLLRYVQHLRGKERAAESLNQQRSSLDTQDEYDFEEDGDEQDAEADGRGSSVRGRSVPTRGQHRQRIVHEDTRAD